MKKIININLSSRLIPIEDSAYELLKNYLDSLKRHFSREEGGEEIVSDIEDRIAEVFQDKLKKGAHCITDDDVNAMVNVMGRPEQLEEETATEPQERAAGTRTAAAPPPRKRLMRDENDKVLGGVCSGIAAYFGIDPVIIRIITFLLILAWGTGLLLYIILWIILPSSRSVSNQVRKRLYRNPDDKVIGGVCSGIAAYLNIEPVIPRIIFVLPLLGVIFTSIFHHWFWFPRVFFPLSIGSLPTLIVLYIILWISVPKAKTVTEKLEMRGEKVDLQSITNAMKGSQEEKKTELASSPASEEDPAGGETAPGNTAYSPGTDAGPKHHSGLGDLLILLLKIFAYFILAVIVIGICVVLVGLAGGFIGAATMSSLMLPYKGLLLHTSLQHILAWPAVILTLGIPVIAIIWLLIKLITGFRPKTKYVGLTLFSLWIIGLVCALCLFVSIGKDFRMNYRETSPVAIQQPAGGRLLLSRTPSTVSISGWNVLHHVIEIGEDTLILKTIRLDILRSKDDSFHVEMIRASNGRSIREARGFARNIHLNISQEDSMLYIPKGFSIPTGNPFRNQHVIVKIFVPEGKQIRVDENLKQLNRHGYWRERWFWDDDRMDDDRMDDDRRRFNWRFDKNYEMTPEGLKDPDEQPGEEAIPAPPPAPRRPAAPDSAEKPYRYSPPSAGENIPKGTTVFNDSGMVSPFL